MHDAHFKRMIFMDDLKVSSAMFFTIYEIKFLFHKIYIKLNFLAQ